MSFFIVINRGGFYDVQPIAIKWFDLGWRLGLGDGDTAGYGRHAVRRIAFRK
jgi:hypothetical protein